MPLFTPSRVVAVVLTLTLMSFMWTYGLPHQLAQPALPIINHDSPQGKPITEPLIPAPAFDTQTEAKATNTLGEVAVTSSVAETGAPAADKEDEKTSTAVPTKAKPSTELSSKSSTPAPKPTPVDPKKFCRDVKGAPNVMVIVRTSKATIGDKLPTNLKKLLACVPNVAIFSDHTGKIDDYEVHNALDDIRETTKTAHEEFQEYEKLQAADYQPKESQAKELDKWKFLPMVYKAYKMKPEVRFYMFIEPDTSLSWTNTLQWIGRLDYRIPYYSGAPTFLGDVRFAQRGSGILLSNGALRQYVKAYDERYTHDWEARVGKECCGDMVLATAMRDAHVEFYSAFPLLQGETPSSLDWTSRHWCVPMISWHHLSPEENEQLWGLQKNWTSRNGWELPFLFRNAFEHFAEPHLVSMKEDWDNISSDTKVEGQEGGQETKAKEEKEKQDKEEDKEKEAAAGTKKPEESVKPEESQELKATTTAEEAPKETAAETPKPKSTEASVSKRETIDWDKIGEQVKDAAESAETCKSLCERAEDCLQWKYTDKGNGECHLGKVIRVGRKAERKEGEPRWTSGWMVDRIQKVTKEWSNDCEKPKWKFNQ
ncbi:hypothetical protein BS50DRAFT_478980 [Corynespora cassiicola Philippines]|uniref:Glycosyltransferase family 31 protein n=1 Tax=Corynespora cassiicola Philippines TaxID=1448308 RepID=A0A2T2PA46_CORCC|nr:hypothetical protein BS50DRAFT_478980 [Corynespora cassiicola Philippines]